MSADGALISQVPGPAPTPVVDGTRAALEAARDKAIARFKPVAATAPAAIPTPGEPPKVDMDPAALKQITKTSAALRAAEQKIAELQASSADTAQVSEAKRLYAAGKRLEAIALLSGKDATEEMAALMDAYLDTTPKEPVDPQAARLEALEKAEKDRKDADELAKKTAAEEKIKAQEAGVRGFAWSVLDAEKEPNGALKFPLSAAKKNRGEAAIAATHLVVRVYAPKEHPKGDVTPDQARSLYARAFAEVESEYEKQYAEELGARFVPRQPAPNPRQSTGQAAPAVPRQATTVPAPTEPSRANQSPTLTRPAISTADYPRSLTPQQALQKAIEKVRSFQR